jgi:hypothetical protein
MKINRLQGTKLYWYVKDMHRLKESIFEETFAPVSRMEEIHLLLAYACSKIVKVYQMDVKSSFLNGEFEEEVYIKQPEGFQL